MQTFGYKKLYLPAVTFIAVVLLLLGIIAFSTHQMLNHQRENALAFFHSQGVALLHTLEVAALTGLRTPMWNEDSVEMLIHEFGKNKNIAKVYIFDRNGIVSHDSTISMDGKQADWRPELENDTQVVARLHKLDNGFQVYELAKIFSPLSHLAQDEAHQIQMKSNNRAFLNHHAGDTLVLSMGMEEFEAAYRADIQHAIIMGATLLVLGTAALFFTFVIQNYYLVDKALNQSRDHLRLVVDSMPNGMLSIDAEGKIISINGPARRLFDIKDTDFTQFDLTSIIDFQLSGIAKTLADGTFVVDKEIFVKKASHQVPLAMSVSPIVYRNQAPPYSGAVIILRDLSEIRRLQEKVRQSEKLAAIGKLAARVAHEVRNPLSSIRGFAQFLKQFLKERPKEREYAEMMVKEVDRINNVVTNLLSFTHPARPERTPTDLSELLHHTARLVREDARARDVTISITVAPDLEKLDLDGNQVTQVMLNLILNALQAVDAGGNVWVEARVTDPGILELSVEDDGKGIPPDEAKRIFDPFYTTKEKGTGLGLSIVQTIVENDGGDIRFASPVPGKTRGSRITIHIPAGKG
jgi:two-component system sensor histidine kinase HydH